MIPVIGCPSCDEILHVRLIDADEPSSSTLIDDSLCHTKNCLLYFDTE